MLRTADRRIVTPFFFVDKDGFLAKIQSSRVIGKEKLEDSGPTKINMFNLVYIVGVDTQYVIMLYRL